mgnify:CR=1 FL=1
MPGFLCDYQNEAVILSDGRVTTCCLDPLAVNVLGDVATDDFAAVEKRYRRVAAAVSRDVQAMPRCRICYEKLKAAGFPATGTYKTDFAPAQRRAFLAQRAVLRQLAIEPTSRCNLKCRGCMQSRHDIPATRRGDFLDLDRLLAWLAPGLPGLRAVRLYNYGETFLHPGAVAFAAALKAARPELVLDIATNGLLLDSPAKREALARSGVDTLYFSIHGGFEASIQTYMTPRFSLDAVLGALTDLARRKRDLGADKPELVWKYLLFAWNDSDAEISRAMRLALAAGVDRMAFAVPGYPSPSPRFLGDREGVRSLGARYARLAAARGLGRP